MTELKECPYCGMLMVKRIGADFIHPVPMCKEWLSKKRGKTND